MSKKKKITLKLSQIYGQVVERDLNNSIFSNIYHEACSSINEIIRENRELDALEKNELKKLNVSNNIISFIGERGSGKSSAIQTVVEALKLSALSGIENKYFTDNGFEWIEKSTFRVIDGIDPSRYENNQSILSIIITEMFKQFKATDRKEANYSGVSRSEIYSLFETVHASISVIEKSELFINPLEALQNMSNASDLKAQLVKLVRNYISYMGNKTSSAGYLVLIIDDIDINAEYAFQMLEEVRKYLLIPKVIILMSYKEDQLRDIFMKEIIDEFGYDFWITQEANGVSDIGVIEKSSITKLKVSALAEKQFEKLFPEKRRLRMPTINDLGSYELEILASDENNMSRCKTVFYSKSLNDAIKELIYSKTGLLFIDREEENLIIPSNIRGVTHLITFLFSMKGNMLTSRTCFSELICEITSMKDDVNLMNVYPASCELLKYLEDTNFNYHDFNELKEIFTNELINYKKLISNRSISVVDESTLQIITDCFTARFNEKKDKGELKSLIENFHRQLIDHNGIRRTSFEETKLNRDKFIEYFVNNWMKNNLELNDYDFAHTLLNNPRNINKVVIEYLTYKYQLRREIVDNRNLIDYVLVNEKLENIINPQNIYQKISLGDVISVLGFIERNYCEKSTVNLLFAIKTIYSFLLYKNYINGEKDVSSKVSKHAVMVGRSVLSNHNEPIINRSRDQLDVNFKVIREFYLSLYNAVFLNDDGEYALNFKKLEDSIMILTDISKDDLNNKMLKGLDKFILNQPFLYIELDDDERNKYLMHLFMFFEYMNYFIVHYRNKQRLRRDRLESTLHTETSIKNYRPFVCFDIMGFITTYNNIDVILGNLIIDENKNISVYDFINFVHEKKIFSDYCPVYKNEDSHLTDFYVGNIDLILNVLNDMSHIIGGDMYDVMRKFISKISNHVFIDETFLYRSFCSNRLLNEISKSFGLIDKNNNIIALKIKTLFNSMFNPALNLTRVDKKLAEASQRYISSLDKIIDADNNLSDFDLEDKLMQLNNDFTAELAVYNQNDLSLIANELIIFMIERENILDNDLVPIIAVDQMTIKDFTTDLRVMKIIYKDYKILTSKKAKCEAFILETLKEEKDKLFDKGDLIEAYKMYYKTKIVDTIKSDVLVRLWKAGSSHV